MYRAIYASACERLVCYNSGTLHLYYPWMDDSAINLHANTERGEESAVIHVVSRSGVSLSQQVSQGDLTPFLYRSMSITGLCL